MKDIQRWDRLRVIKARDCDQWVKAADAEAAIAAAFQSGMDQMIGSIEKVSYDRGQRDMLTRCMSAVEDEEPAPNGVWLHAATMKGRIWLSLREIEYKT